MVHAACSMWRTLKRTGFSKATLSPLSIWSLSHHTFRCSAGISLLYQPAADSHSSAQSARVHLLRRWFPTLLSLDAIPVSYYLFLAVAKQTAILPHLSSPLLLPQFSPSTFYLFIFIGIQLGDTAPAATTPKKKAKVQAQESAASAVPTGCRTEIAINPESPQAGTVVASFSDQGLRLLSFAHEYRI